jgi:hypothetical protein
MTTSGRNHWGPYRCTVADRLAACEDYLGRLRRSLAGEIAPDRHYFAEKALALRDAAQTLVEGTEDVEWWLGACTHKVAANGPDEDSESFAECGRAAGHPGSHQDEDRCPEQLALGEMRRLARALQHLTDRVGLDLLHVRAGAGVTDPEALARDLRQVNAGITRAVSAAIALATPSDTADR